MLFFHNTVRQIKTIERESTEFEENIDRLEEIDTNSLNWLLVSFH